MAAQQPPPEKMMFQLTLRSRGISDQAVLRTMEEVPREAFVEKGDAAYAYRDSALGIECGQTISQPFVVAYMTEQLGLRKQHRVLEIGTGSGYQAAVLAELGLEVDTIEIVPALAETARQRLAQLGYDRVTVRTGDGHAGWPERAPYDIVMLTAAPPEIPAPLLAQLKPGGRLVAPVGPAHATQELVLVEKDPAGKLTTKRIAFVRFVPFTGGPRLSDRDDTDASR